MPRFFYGNDERRKEGRKGDAGPTKGQFTMMMPERERAKKSHFWPMNNNADTTIAVYKQHQAFTTQQTRASAMTCAYTAAATTAITASATTLTLSDVEALSCGGQSRSPPPYTQMDGRS